VLIVGIEATELTANDRRNLLAPAVSGVVLFARNYRNREQLIALIAAIRALRTDRLVICVDHEGGPVQRFRDGFTRLPALARIGTLYRHDRAAGIAMAEVHARVMARELRACDVDLSFAPVLDLARGNRVIGARAFDADPAVVATLGAAYVRGMHLAGMAATLKHYPGHGSVPEDTHLEDAIDPRPLAAIERDDLVPFAAGFAAGAEAVMAAYVTYPAVDDQAAGYSKKWIDEVLRKRLGFRGVVFSDDVTMAAAGSVGGVAARVTAHLDAGCDLVLVSEPALVAAAIASVAGRSPCSCDTLAPLAGVDRCKWRDLDAGPEHARRVAALHELAAPPIGLRT
jgi:beta-N-acetylhexosaminidase